MAKYEVQRSTEALKFTVYKDHPGTKQSILIVKQYADGHLGFACAATSYIKAYFFDEYNASEGCEAGRGSIIRKCRQAPEEYAELTIDGIRCAMDARYLEVYIDKNPELITKCNIKLANNINPETQKLTDFIYKVDDSKLLKVNYSSNKFDDYFNNTTNSDDVLYIAARETNIPILTMSKKVEENKQHYIISIDINNEDGDCFRYKTTFKTLDEFYLILDSVIDSLRTFKNFSKYADELADLRQN